MPFNSIPFFIFFIVFTTIFYILKDHNKRNLLVLVGSYFFFAYANIFNLLYLLLITLVTDFTIQRIQNNHRSNFLFWGGILSVVSILLFTKYIVVQGEYLFGIQTAENPYLNYLIFPIGISFYSLQAISLISDVYSGKYQGDKSRLRIASFLSFFPQSVSGPIHRPGELIPQFADNKKMLSENIFIGIKIMLWGYLCKVIIADKTGLIIEPVFNVSNNLDGPTILIAIFLYSFQIYFDFLGYSLIAIGCGRILGFKINTNFLNPYSATTIKEFWHRWHITLSKWMRDYIYIPLGGNMQKKHISFIGVVFATFLVSSLWHGTSMNYFIWGSLHATAYILENLINTKRGKIQEKGTRLEYLFLKRIVFFLFISFTWFVFRTENLNELKEMLIKTTDVSGWSFNKAVIYYFNYSFTIYFIFLFGAILLSGMPYFKKALTAMPGSIFAYIKDAIFIILSLILLLLWGDIGAQEFLYFRF
jgi:D-alanyl-lipoteichoic acid acyltransferase DltB (MBOAT superfamily)